MKFSGLWIFYVFCLVFSSQATIASWCPWISERDDEQSLNNRDELSDVFREAYGYVPNIVNEIRPSVLTRNFKNLARALVSPYVPPPSTIETLRRLAKEEIDEEFFDQQYLVENLLPFLRRLRSSALSFNVAEKVDEVVDFYLRDLEINGRQGHAFGLYHEISLLILAPYWIPRSEKSSDIADALKNPYLTEGDRDLILRLCYLVKHWPTDNLLSLRDIIGAIIYLSPNRKKEVLKELTEPVHVDWLYQELKKFRNFSGFGLGLLLRLGPKAGSMLSTHFHCFGQGFSLSFKCFQNIQTVEAMQKVEKRRGRLSVIYRKHWLKHVWFKESYKDCILANLLYLVDDETFDKLPDLYEFIFEAKDPDDIITLVLMLFIEIGPGHWESAKEYIASERALGNKLKEREDFYIDLVSRVKFDGWLTCVQEISLPRQ